MRVWRELDIDGVSPWFRSLSRNKKSVTIDIRRDEGKRCAFDFILICYTSHLKPVRFDVCCRLVKALAVKSDILLENFKPGSAFVFLLFILVLTFLHAL